MLHLTRHLKIPLSVVCKLGRGFVDGKQMTAPLACKTVLLPPDLGTQGGCNTKRFISCAIIPKRDKSCEETKCDKVKPPCKPKSSKDKIKCKPLEDLKPADSNASKKKKKSMWLNPDCCILKCVMPDRYDIHYYRPINYHNRKYQKTWISCEKIKPKPRCEPVKFIYPKPKRRKFKRRATGRAKTGCDRELTEFAKTLMPCKKPTAKTKCPKISLKGCRDARSPPKCFKTRVPLDCEKVLCPWPSFSECEHPKLRELPPEECLCLAGVPLCILYRYLNAMNNSKH